MKNILLLTTLLFSIKSFSQGPTAQFTATPLTACVGETITFTSTSVTGGAPITLYSFDFGDGSPFGTTQVSTHSYTSPGTYDIILVVTDQNSVADDEVKLGFITINANPTAQFTATSNGCSLPVSTTFTNQSTTGSNISYAWNFGNGQTSILQTPGAISYSTANNYTITLDVTNTTTLCHSSISHTITISDFTTDFTIPDSACVGTVVSMQDNSSSGVNTWTWNSGNGIPLTSNLQNPSFTYNTPGTYTVSLNSGNTTSLCSDSQTHQIVIVPKPLPTFTATPTSGCIPLPVTFTNTSTSGSNFTWNYGDGSAVVIGQGPFPHTYTTNGVFIASLTSTGTFGCVSLPTTVIIQTSPPVANFTANPIEGCSPLSVHFNNFSFSPSATDPINNWAWTFNDGNINTSSLQNPTDVIYTTGIYDVTLIVTTLNGCRDTLTRTEYIQVGDIDLVDFTNTPVIQCAKSPVVFTGISVISATHNPDEVTYLWNFGDPIGQGSSTDLSPTYTYPADTGSFDVTFEVTFRGCKKDTTIVDAVFIKAPISLFTLPDPSCNPASFPVSVTTTDDAIIGKPSDDVKMIWKWYDASPSTTFTTTVYEDADLDPDDDGPATFLYNTYGTYKIEQVIYNYTTGCSDSTSLFYTISQTIPSFTLSENEICKGETISLDGNASTTIVLPPSSDQTLDYSYNMSIGLPLNGVSQNYTYTTAGNFLITLTVTNSANCSASTSLPITVYALPIADISFDNTGCIGDNTPFTNTSFSPVNGYPDTPTFGSFYWTLPDNSHPTTTDANYLFNSAGTFTIKLQATDDFGCVSLEEDFLMTITKPTPNFTFNRPVVCNSEIFTATSTGINGVSYQWKVDGVEEQIDSPSTTFPFSFTEISTATSVSHTVKLIVTDINGCKDSITNPITISLPNASVTPTITGANMSSNNTFTCPPVYGNYDNTSTDIGTYTSIWNFDDGKTSVFNDAHNTFVFAGDYVVSLVITDQYGCKDSLLMDTIKIGGPKAIPLITMQGDLCDNLFEFDTTAMVGVDHWEWDFGDGSPLETIAPVTHDYPLQGVYKPVLIFYDSLGCRISDTLDALSLPNELDANFVPSTFNTTTGSSITFDDQSLYNAPGATWLWDFGDFNNYTILNNTDVNTSYSYSLPYIYPVTLTVTDINGCQDSFQVIIHITGNVEVPNVFTPNGDGKNDNFKFPYDIFKSYDVLILNRWGEVVYEKENNSETYIWNGTKMEGEQCSEGVYFYKIKGFLIDDSPFDVTGFLTKI